MNEQKKQQTAELDVPDLIRKTLYYLRRLWFLILILAVLGAGVMFLSCRRSYTPIYKTEAVFSVTVDYVGNSDLLNYSYYYGNGAAKLAAESFPYLLDSDVMKELIRLKLGTDYINGTVSASSVASTNLFVITVESPDPRSAYDIIVAVMESYPQVARQVIGETQLVVSREPTVPVEPYNTFEWSHRTLVGAAAGAAVALALLVLLGYTRRTVTSSETVRKLLNLKKLASIPKVSKKERSNDEKSSMLLMNQESNSEYREAFRQLRIKLMHELSGDDHVLLVTSSMPSEGKSSISANIALSLAADDHRVLLIDADLRGPSIKSIFGITKNTLGLGECLKSGLKNVSLERYQKTNLYIFAGDMAHSNPLPLIKHYYLKEIMTSLRPMFDYIVIDTPPCAVMADAVSLSRYADKVAYVIRADYTTETQVIEGVQALTEGGADICGFIMNMTDEANGSSYGYGKKYGYKYGYRYGKDYGYSKEKK